MKEKIDKKDVVEANNLLEQASEIMSDCVSCGLCKVKCPTFLTLRDESVSGRGQAVLLRNKILTKALFQNSLSKGQEIICPKGVKINQAILKAREAAVLLKVGLKENEEMMENIRKYGNPYGNFNLEKQDKLQN